MKAFIPTLLLSLFCLGFNNTGNFKAGQLKYPCVRQAYTDKWSIVKNKLTKAGIDTSHFEIFIRIFKKEQSLEIWARSKHSAIFTLVDKYDICRSSGELGPKRKEGDMQVPEGFYHVSVFQPNSEFYLALQVSYPNQADRIKGDASHPGGDIMIHGNCVTIGCMPMTDDKIKEIYLMAIEAHNGGQENIPIHIFPTQLNEKGMQYLTTVTTDKTILSFWSNLQEGYTYFEQHKTIPLITIKANGDYAIE